MIVDGHRPIYTTSISDSVVGVAQELRNYLEPLLLKYQVTSSPILPCFCGSLVIPQRYSMYGSREVTIRRHAMCVKVDLTWHGHDHVYERTCPVYNGTCQPNLPDGSLGGPTHVVIGNAGFSLSYAPLLRAACTHTGRS